MPPDSSDVGIEPRRRVNNAMVRAFARGFQPMGYRVENPKLVIHEAEAATIRCKTTERGSPAALAFSSGP
jgi:hypothetical protein